MKLISNGKIIGHNTNQHLKANLKKIKADINNLNQAKLRLKYNYNLEKDLTYRKMISDLHLKTLINLAEKSPNIKTQQWGVRLKTIGIENAYH